MKCGVAQRIWMRGMGVCSATLMTAPARSGDAANASSQLLNFSHQNASHKRLPRPRSKILQP